MASVSTQSESRSSAANSIELVADSLAFGIVFTLILTIVQRAVGFFRGILFCRMMSDEQLGQWSIIFSSLMLLAPLAAMGMPGSFARFVEHYLQKGQLRTFLGRTASISATCTILLSGTMYWFPDVYSNLIFRSPNFAPVVNSMAFALVMVAASNYLISLVESLRQVRLVAIMRFIQGIGFALVAIIFVSTWENQVTAATLGYGIACLICCLPAVWFLWNKKTVLQDNGSYLSHQTMWARIGPFAIWLWASNLVWNLFELGDRYMLVHWSACSANEAHGLVGQYHSARVVPLLLVGVAVVLEGMITPYMTALWEKKREQESGKQLVFALKLLSVGFTAGSVAILLLSPILFEAILAGRYNDGLSVLPLTLLYCIWFSMCLFGQIQLWVAEKGKWVFAITTFGLGTNLILNAVLIPQFGLGGAVSATTIATLLCLILSITANHAAQNPTHPRVWILCATPLIVLLPLAGSVVAVMVLASLTWQTNLLFDLDERVQISALIRKFRNKLSY